MDNLNFSQRYGYEPLPEAMQLESLSDDLRREIWNVMWRFLQHKLKKYSEIFFNSEGERFVERILGKLLKKSEDEIPRNAPEVCNVFKNIIFNFSFNQVLDLLQIVVNDPAGKEIADKLKTLFEKYAAPYWFTTSGAELIFVPISTKEEGEAIQNAFTTLEASSMEGATIHLRQAIEHINAQQYADAITDSIHAVESVAKQIDPKANKTLSPALDSLEKAEILKHSALKEAFKKLYGYTSDEQGIRHALLNEGAADVGLDEAMFMLGACASFSAYLTKKHKQVEGQKDDST